MTLLEEIERRRSGAVAGAGRPASAAAAGRPRHEHARPHPPATAASETTTETPRGRGPGLQASPMHPASLQQGNSELGYAILVAAALFVVHATLALIARVQYGQDVEPAAVAKEAARAMPVFTLLVYLLHPFRSRAAALAGLLASVCCGCYIVYLFNVEGYYASMSRVPAIGTLWIWLFIELDWYYGLATLVLVGAYTQVNGFSLT